MAESKMTQMYATRQTRGDEDHGQTSLPMPAHDEIVRRAYEIYIKNGLRQGQCERNWHQAENDLRNERKEYCMTPF